MRTPVLERLALHRPELRAWAMYDWANSAFMTTVVAAVFPVYFQRVAAAGLPPPAASFRFAMVTTVAIAVSALLSPLLGAIADYAAVKKRMLAGFLGLGVLATAGLFFVRRGDWAAAAVLFALANIGAMASFVFYDALLPHITRNPEETDRLSSSGYALGYVGGGVLLALNLAWIRRPELFGLGGPGIATRLSFVSVAVWWAVFSVPLFLRVAEPPRAPLPAGQEDASPLRAGLLRLRNTWRSLRAFPDASLLLLAALVYNDGIGTIIRMATTYGAEIGLSEGSLIGALLLAQFVGIPFSLLFGQLSGWMGVKRAILAGLAVYGFISVFAYFMSTATHFFVLAILVGTVQGGTQALSRSLFSSMIPRQRSSEFFALFGVFEKFAGIAGPAFFAVMIALTGSSRGAILSVIVFFAVGALLLARVDVDAGRAAARRAEEAPG